MRAMFIATVTTMLTCASFPAASEEVGTYGEWILWEEIDQMTDKRRLTLWNHSGVETGWFGSNGLALGLNCGSYRGDMAELAIIGDDTLVYDKRDSLGFLVQTVNTRFDDGPARRVEFTFLDEYGTSAITFPHRMDTISFLEKIREAGSVLIEVETYSEGEVVYEIDLTGLGAGLSECTHRAMN